MSVTLSVFSAPGEHDRRVCGYQRGHGEGVPLLIHLALPPEAIGQDSRGADLIAGGTVFPAESTDLHVGDKTVAALRETFGDIGD